MTEDTEKRKVRGLLWGHAVRNVGNGAGGSGNSGESGPQTLVEGFTGNEMTSRTM